MPVFYGFYFEDDALQGAFDLIRFFAEPRYFRRAHITVRGPYDDIADSEIAELNRTIRKPYEIKIEGPGSFFESGQNTVLLKCLIPGVEEIWKKPSYGEGINPHVTLYDNNDRGVAQTLLFILKKYNWAISTQATSLSLIGKKQIPDASSLDNFFKAAQAWNQEIFGRTIDYGNIQFMNSTKRMSYVPQICDYLERNYFKNKSS